jgi:hypothetical protein
VEEPGDDYIETCIGQEQWYSPEEEEHYENEDQVSHPEERESYGKVEQFRWSPNVEEPPVERTIQDLSWWMEELFNEKEAILLTRLRCHATQATHRWQRALEDTRSQMG